MLLQRASGQDRQSPFACGYLAQIRSGHACPFDFNAHNDLPKDWMERVFYVVRREIVPIFIDRGHAKFLGIPEICRRCPIQDWPASDASTAQSRMRFREFRSHCHR
jgi:hypothetical protein